MTDADIIFCLLVTLMGAAFALAWLAMKTLYK